MIKPVKTLIIVDPFFLKSLITFSNNKKEKK
jgi:hypothetical protein